MDAKHGDQVFTPRIGKPVEINALWMNAWMSGARLASQLRNAASSAFANPCSHEPDASFGRFWNERRGCLYDVIDVDGGAGRRAHPAESDPGGLPALLRPCARRRCEPWSTFAAGNC